MANRKNIKRHGGKRGAAMVEGIVVMTTMLVMLGMNMFAYRAYGGKVDQMTSTRRDVLYYASHACETNNSRDPDTYTTPSLRGLTGQARSAEQGNMPPPDAGRDQRANAISGGVGGGLGGAVDRTLNTASGGKQGQVLGSALHGNGSIFVVPNLLRANVATNSWATCNEKRYDNQWTALFQFGWNFLRTAAGAG